MYSASNMVLEEGINLNEIADKVSSFFLKNKEKFIAKFKYSSKELDNKLRKYNINPEEIKRIASNDVKNAKLKNNKIVNFKENLNSFANAFSKKNLITDSNNNNIFMQTAKAILLFACMLYLVTFLYGISTMLFGPRLAEIIASVIVAPIFEEGAKFISIKSDFTGMFFVVFNVYEFSMYVMMMISGGMSVGLSIFYRTLPLIMHFLTTAIQYICIKEANMPKTGYAIGVGMHFIWNTLSTITD